MEQTKPLLYPNASRDKVWVSSKSNITKCIFEIQCKFAEKNEKNPCELKVWMTMWWSSTSMAKELL